MGAALVLSAAASAATAQGADFTRLPSVASLEALMPTPAARATLRIGDRAKSAQSEALLSAEGLPDKTLQVGWKKTEVVPLRVAYDGFGNLDLRVGTQNLRQSVAGTLTHIGFEASSTHASGRVLAQNLQLNLTPLGMDALATGSSGSDVLWLASDAMQHGFVLFCDLSFEWSAPVPVGDALRFEMRLGAMAPLVTGYCAAINNSTGVPCRLDWNGSPSLGANHFSLAASGGVPGSAGLFIVGAGAQLLPFGNGFLCVAPPLQRLSGVLAFDAQGQTQFAPDWPNSPLGVGGALEVQPGEQRMFQLWYRDPLGFPSTSNLSDALAVTFVP